MHSNVCGSKQTEKFGRLMKRQTCTERIGNRCNLKRGKGYIKMWNENIVQLKWFKKG
jgi:hypothetical protein